MKLDLLSFKKAVKSLNAALKDFNKDNDNDYIRDAVIQRFEYTYELSYKFLRRYLQLSLQNANEVDEMSFSDIIRSASAKGLLLNNLEKWIEYRKMRNTTSHTYDEAKADAVIAIAPNFLKDAKFLLKTLDKKGDKQWELI
ncbi:MAG: nucleotidyltransferase substrate binding protein [Elusimicrobiota bacterium]|jgi:nucleotidyltransferase substrate binding protein (TIGR01987 family)|nr:nucleotidyltransferase substrate binding protein [Elusimicrobiota bacterium]